MAVQETSTGGESPPAGEKKKSGSLNTWVKQHKLAAGGIGLGATVLLLSHKGSKSGGNAATEAAAQQQALDNQRAAAEAGSIIPAASPGTPEGAGGGEGTSPGGNTPSLEPVTDPRLADAVGGLGAAVGALAAAETEAASAKDAAAGTAKKPSAQKPKSKHKPAGKHPEKHGTKHHNPKTPGVTVHGRHFPGATGLHRGPVHNHSNGEKSQHITIHYPGHTHTVISHNGGGRWTDHAPGHTPPSRGVPTGVRDHRVPAKPKPKAKPKPRAVVAHRR